MLRHRRHFLHIIRRRVRRKKTSFSLHATRVIYLVAKSHNINCVVVRAGDGCARLEAIARDGGVSEGVRFLGAVELQSLVELHRMADLLAMPATSEGFGIAFLEAMAGGTPALGLDVAGARDVLADGQLGTAVRGAELTAAIARLWHDTVVRYKRSVFENFENNNSWGLAELPRARSGIAVNGGPRVKDEH